MTQARKSPIKSHFLHNSRANDLPGLKARAPTLDFMFIRWTSICQRNFYDTCATAVGNSGFPRAACARHVLGCLPSQANPVNLPFNFGLTRPVPRMHRFDRAASRDHIRHGVFDRAIAWGALFVGCHGVCHPVVHANDGGLNYRPANVQRSPSFPSKRETFPVTHPRKPGPIFPLREPPFLDQGLPTTAPLPDVSHPKKPRIEKSP